VAIGDWEELEDALVRLAPVSQLTLPRFFDLFSDFDLCCFIENLRNEEPAMTISLYRLNRRVAAVALLVASVLATGLCVPAQADTLVDFFGNSIVSGEAPYAGPTINGTVAYAVYKEATFESNFPGFDVPDGQWGYIYQVLNGDGDPVSQNAIVAINSSVMTIGDVTIDGTAGETAPQGSTLMPAVSAVWDFSGIGNNIPALGGSNGLVMTSTNQPGDASTLDILVDGGASAFTMVIAPGPIPIPEPASLLLLGLGGVLLATRRRR
jgi:hypothetical protein